jgi:hypothetical protein
MTALTGPSARLDPKCRNHGYGKDMPLIGPNPKTAAAAALIRAGLADDADAGVLLAMAALSVRVLLTSNGFEYDRALAIVDHWIAQYDKAQVVAPDA